MLRRKRGRQGRIRRGRQRFIDSIERMTGVPIEEALARYDRGEYRGRIVEVEISCFRHLFDGYDEEGNPNG